MFLMNINDHVLKLLNLHLITTEINKEIITKKIHPLLSVRLNKHMVNALVDTGAQSTLID